MKTSSTTTAAVAVIAGLAMALALLTPSGGSRASAEKGLAIATEVDNRDRGWGDVTVEGEMVLKNKAGKESVRKFRSTILEAEDSAEGDQSIITFSKPRDVRGTALLTHSKIEPDDDSQWIFLPAVKRVKRISSSNRTGKFDMTHTLTTYFGLRDFNATLFTNDTTVFQSLILPTQAFIVLYRAKNTRAE